MMTKLFWSVIVTLAFACSTYAQNVGVNTSNPNATLDVNGDIALRSYDIEITAANETELNLNTNRFSNYKLKTTTLVGDMVLSGIAAGQNGRQITLFNHLGGAIIITHLDAAASPENQIHTGFGNNLVVYQGGNVSLNYDGTLQKWQISAGYHSNLDQASGGGSEGWQANGSHIHNTNTGNVGIGITEPTAKLALVGTAPNGTLAISGTNHTSHFNYPQGGLEHLYLRGGTNGSHIFLNDAPGLGNVGIGTNLPSYKLQVEGNGYFGGTRLVSGSGPWLTSGGALTLRNSTLNTYMVMDGEGIQAHSSGPLLGAISSELYLNKFGGKVGIGTNFTPEAKLHLWANNDQLMKIDGTNPYILFHDRQSNAQYGFFRAWTNNPNNGIGYYGLEIGVPPSYGTDPAKYLIFTNNFGVRMVIAPDGNVGIGTVTPTHKLSVNGGIRAKEVRVNTGWADYVFEPDYQLNSLKNVELFIKENKHLPDIPSAAEIQKEGLDVGAVQTKMMAKIEELTLYLIEANKKIEQLEKSLLKLNSEK